MEKEMFDRVDSLVNQKWLDEMVEKAYYVAYDACVCEPFEKEDVLKYLTATINERVGSKLEEAFEL